MIKAMFFDIGNVLVFFSYTQMCDQVATLCGLTREELHNHLVNDDIGPKYEKGAMTTEEVCDYIISKGRLSPSQEELVDAMVNIFAPNKEIYPIVHAVKSQNIKIVLLSNTCEAHFHYLEQSFPIITEFDLRILSYEVKARKPEAKIFDAAIEIAQCTPQECFYIDDIEEYTKAANSLGIDAEPYKDVGTLVSHLHTRGVAAET